MKTFCTVRAFTCVAFWRPARRESVVVVVQLRYRNDGSARIVRDDIILRHARAHAMVSLGEMSDEQLLRYATVLVLAQDREKDWLYARWGAARVAPLRIALEYAIDVAQRELTARQLDGDVEDGEISPRFAVVLCAHTGFPIDRFPSYQRLDDVGRKVVAESQRRRPWLCSCLKINDGHDGRCTRQNSDGDFVCEVAKPIDEATAQNAPWTCARCAGLNFGRRTTCWFGSSRNCGCDRQGNEWIPRRR